MGEEDRLFFVSFFFFFFPKKRAFRICKKGKGILLGVLIALLTVFYLFFPQITSKSCNISRKKSEFEFD